MDITPLSETLHLEQLEVNLFRGVTPSESPGRIFGGQVIAQTLLAAYQTVDDRLCHSLHCYFIRPGDPSIPIIFEVDRSRDGGSFTTRRVVAIQHGQQIFVLAASFMAPEGGFEHQEPMPPVGTWEGIPDDTDAEMARLNEAPLEAQRWMTRLRAIEMRTVVAPGDSETAARSRLWFRAREPIAGDQRMHQAILAYASDMSLLSTAMRPHALSFSTPGFQPASLDHAMWFHHPLNFNDWHLYALDSPSASGGRGFIRGSIFSQNGTLVASVAQEGLMRMRRPK